LVFLRRTAYVKDADRNLQDRDARLEAAVVAADTMLDEKAERT
jgi:hypothetical protein